MLIVAVPLLRTLDLFGPVEVFGDTNRLHGRDLACEVNIISSGPERVVLSHLGTPPNTDQTYRECRGPIDTLLVVGYDSHQELRFEQDFLNWLREHSERRRRFGSVCTGALVLAAAGLLDGRRATPIWKWCDDLTRAYPLVTVDRNPIYVRDGNGYTSAGVTAGIDLALALVEEHLGRPVALKVAQIMVVFLQRSGGQSQFSTTLAAQTRENRPLGDLLAWLPDKHPARPHGRQSRTTCGHESAQLRSLFRQDVGKTPSRTFVSKLRDDSLN